MIDAVQVLWSAGGVTMPSLGGRPLVDVSEGDTPNVRMPVRMLSIDTPEVTARSEAGAARVDQRFSELAQWIRDRRAPISRELAEYVLPKLASGEAGTLHFRQGMAASTFAKENIEMRLLRPDGSRRDLFVRTSGRPFDSRGRLLAYVAPDYSDRERAQLTRRQRATFNLDLVGAGWAAPFVIYPLIPGELDLPLLVDAAATARAAGAGAWAEVLAMPGYEYRSMQRLHAVTAKIVSGEDVADRFAWRDRYCADMRDRVLYGPEAYPAVPPEYRLWLRPADVADGVSRLNLTPAPDLVMPR